MYIHVHEWWMNLYHVTNVIIDAVDVGGVVAAQIDASSDLRDLGESRGIRCCTVV